MLRMKLRTASSHAAAAALLLLAALSAGAEEASDNPWRDIMLKGRDEAADLIAKADAWLAACDFQRAVPACQRVLLEFPDSLVPAGQDRMTSAAEHVLSRIASFPPEARRIYEVLYSGAAAAKAADLEDERDPRGLAGLARTYPATAAGLLAAEGAARIHFRRGEHEKALRMLNHLFRFAGPDEARWARDAAMMAVCHARTGQAPPQGGVVARLSAAPGAAKLRFQGREADLCETLRKALTRVAATGVPPAEGGWPFFGGDASACRAADGDIQNLTRQSSRDLPEVPMTRGDGNQTDSLFSNIFFLRDVFRPFQPVSRNGVVYVHNGIEFLALNMLKDWEVAWRYRSPHPPADFDDEKFEPNATYTGTVHGGVFYAPMAIPFDSSEIKSKIWQNFITVIQDIPHRRLMALDAATGELLWSAGGRQHAVALADRLSFFAAPCASGGDVFAPARIATGSVTHFIVKFDGRTGAVQWISHVCSGQNELNMFGRQVRESFGSSVSLRNGLLYYCTNLGVVACLDADTGTRKWLFRYKSVESELAPDLMTHKTPPQWYNNPVIASESAVVVTPTDSPLIYGLDPATGEPLWKKENSRRTPRRGGYFDGSDAMATGHFYVLGATQGKVFLSGSKVEALNLRTGASVWTAEFDQRASFEYSRGRGTVSKGVAYVPTGMALYLFDAEKGTKIAKKAWSRPDASEAGNLVITDGVLVSAGPRGITSFFDIESIYRDILARIARDPGNPELHLRAANACIGSKTPRYADAARHFLEARRLAGPKSALEAEAGRGLFACYMREAGDKWKLFQFSSAQESYEKALVEAPGGEDVVAVRLKLAEIHEKKSNAKAAETEYETLIRDHGGLMYDFLGTESQRSGEEIPVGLWSRFRLAELHERLQRFRQAVAIYQDVIASYRGVKYRRTLTDQARDADSAAAARIGEIVSKAGPTVFEEFNRRAADLYAKGVAENDSSLFRKVIDLYPNSDIHPKCVTALAKALLKAGKAGEAIGLLKSFREKFPSSPHTPHALHVLALAYESENLLSISKRILKQLSSEWPQVRISTDDGPAFAGVWAEERLKGDLYRGISALEAPPDLGWPLNQIWTRPLPPRGNPVIVRPSGLRPSSAKDSVFMLYAKSLECFSATDSKKRWEVQIDADAGGVLNSLLVGSRTAVLVTDRGAIGIDLTSGRKLWKKTLPAIARVKGASIGGDVVAINVAENHQSSGLLVLDAISGTEIFARSGLRGQFSGSVPLLGPSGIVTFTRNIDSAVYAFNTDSETPVFEVRAEAGFQSLPVMLANSDLAWVSNDSLVVVGGKDGKVAWRYGIAKAQQDTMRTDGERIAEIACPDDRVPFAVTGTLLLIDPAGKALKWKTQLDRNLGYAIDSFSQDHVYLVEKNFSGSDASTGLTAFSLIDGSLAWKIRLLASDSAKVTTVIGRELGLVQAFVRDGSGRYKGQYSVFDIKSGLLRRQIQIDSQLKHTPTFDVADGKLVFVADGLLEAWGR